MNTMTANQTPHALTNASDGAKTPITVHVESPVRIVGNVFETLVSWQRRYQQRRHLMQLDGHLLEDMGISRADVAREVSKPVWKN